MKTCTLEDLDMALKGRPQGRNGISSYNSVNNAISTNHIKVKIDNTQQYSVSHVEKETK